MVIFLSQTESTPEQLFRKKKALLYTTEWSLFVVLGEHVVLSVSFVCLFVFSASAAHRGL
jgi:hypothetical protein